MAAPLNGEIAPPKVFGKMVKDEEDTFFLQFAGVPQEQHLDVPTFGLPALCTPRTRALPLSSRTMPPRTRKGVPPTTPTDDHLEMPVQRSLFRCTKGASQAFMDALQQLTNIHLAELKAISEVELDVAKSQLNRTITTPGPPCNNDQPIFEVSESLISNHAVEVDLPSLTENQRQLVEVFRALDRDGSGSLTSDELRRALCVVGLPNARVVKMLRMADLDRSGEIEISEWTSAVARNDLDEFADTLDIVDIDEVINRLNSDELFKEPEKNFYVLLPTSTRRLLWDVLVILSCVFLALEFPFVVAWKDSIAEGVINILRVPEIAIDIVLVVDIGLNFFTGYYDGGGTLVLELAAIRRHYLKSWFMLDFISSIPFEIVTGGWNMQIMKLLKCGKVVRFFKMLKIGKMELADVSDFLADIASSKAVHKIRRRGSLLFYMFFVCHWMACCMKAVDKGFLRNFIYSGSLWDEYLVAWYWSVTTLATVGYGDITPATKGELVFVIFAMVVGGAFYGYVVGTMASMVASSDLNATAYFERMDIVHAWLTHHNLPYEIKRRLRRFFKSMLERKSAANEADLWHDLTQELQMEVAQYIIRDTVKANPLFDRLGLGAIVQLQSVVRHWTMEAKQRVTTAGQVGTAMYMIDSGCLKWDRRSERSGSMGPGESFGEEILLGFREDYEYTVEVVTRAKLEVIEEGDFLAAFQHMPKVVDTMRRNALMLTPEWGDNDGCSSYSPSERMSTSEKSGLDKIVPVRFT